MSVIIGYKADGKVYMATDTQRRLGNYYYSDLTETGFNVFHLPSGVLCGASNYRAKQILQTKADLWEALGDGPLTKQFIVECILPTLYRSLDDANLIDSDKKTDGDSEFDGSILFAKGDSLFCIDDDFSVLTIPKFCMIGSGAAFSYARVAAYQGEYPLEKMFFDALADAESFCRTVLKPYCLYATDCLEKKFLGGESC